MSEVREALPPPPPPQPRRLNFGRKLTELTGPKIKLTGPKIKLTRPKIKLTGPKIKLTGPKKVRKYYEEHIEKGVIALHAESRPYMWPKVVFVKQYAIVNPAKRCNLGNW